MFKYLLLALVAGSALTQTTTSWTWGEYKQKKDVTFASGTKKLVVGMKLTSATAVRVYLESNINEAALIAWNPTSATDWSSADILQIYKDGSGNVAFVDCYANTGSTATTLKLACNMGDTEDWKLAGSTAGSLSSWWQSSSSGTGGLGWKVELDRNLALGQTGHDQALKDSSNTVAVHFVTGSEAQIRARHATGTDTVGDITNLSPSTLQTVPVDPVAAATTSASKSSSNSALTFVSWIALLISLIALN